MRIYRLSRLRLSLQEEIRTYRNLEKIIVTGRVRCGQDRSVFKNSSRLSYDEVNNSIKRDKKIINQAFASRLLEQNSSHDLRSLRSKFENFFKFSSHENKIGNSLFSFHCNLQ